MVIGVAVRDITRYQYVNGVLVDLSSAWTVPHLYGPERGLWPSWTFASLAAGDLRLFQCAIVDWWNYYQVPKQAGRKKIRVRAYKQSPDPDVSAPDTERFDKISRLRNLKHRADDTMGPFLPLLGQVSSFGPMLESPPFDPSKFDWKSLVKVPALPLSNDVAQRTKCDQITGKANAAKNIPTKKKGCSGRDDGSAIGNKRARRWMAHKEGRD